MIHLTLEQPYKTLFYNRWEETGEIRSKKRIDFEDEKLLIVIHPARAQ